MRRIMICIAVAACVAPPPRPVEHLGPPLGQSTAPGPTNPSVPAPDAAGVPPVDQPLPPIEASDGTLPIDASPAGSE
jgi:hypothetical protein